MYFIDTLSLHMCITGLTGLQRNLCKAASVGKADKEDWMEISALNNLQDIYQLYCGGTELDKEKKSVFVHGTLDDVKEQFQVVDLEGQIHPLFCMQEGSGGTFVHFRATLLYYSFNLVANYDQNTSPPYR